MIPDKHLTDREWLLLSAYLDGQLSEKERRQVEDLLQSNPASRSALEGLRRACLVLRHAPTRRVPRNFTLSAEQAHKPFLPSFSRLLSYSSALAGLLLVIALGFDLFIGRNAMNLARRSGAAPAEVAKVFMADEAAQAPSAESPAIIYWNGVYSPLLGAYGKGGGGGDESGSAGYAYGIGGGGAESPAAIMPSVEEAPAVAAEEESLLAEETPVDADMGMSAPEMAAPESAPAAKQPQELEEAAPESALEMDASAAGAYESLILGVRPSEERGAIQLISGGYAPASFTRAFPWRLIEIALAAAAFLAGLGALALRKQR